MNPMKNFLELATHINNGDLQGILEYLYRVVINPYDYFEGDEADVRQANKLAWNMVRAKPGLIKKLNKAANRDRELRQGLLNKHPTWC